MHKQWSYHSLTLTYRYKMCPLCSHKNTWCVFCTDTLIYKMSSALAHQCIGCISCTDTSKLCLLHWHINVYDMSFALTHQYIGCVFCADTSIYRMCFCTDTSIYCMCLLHWYWAWLLHWHIYRCDVSFALAHQYTAYQYGFCNHDNIFPVIPSW